MRNQLRLRNLLILFILSLGIYSCQDDDVTLEIPKDNQTSLSENFAKVEQFLTLKNNLNQLKSRQSSISRFGLNANETPSNGRVSECTEGNGNYLTEDITTSSFNKLQIQAGVNGVYISEGETQSITVTVDSNILDSLDISVSNNILSVKGRDNVCLSNYMLDMDIVVPNLESIDFAGSGAVSIGDFTNTEKLSITNAGSGLIGVGKYSKATALEIVNRGSGHITMYEPFPELESYEVTSQGSGDYYGCVVNVEKCVVKNMGSGYVGVSATDNLSLELLGSGTIEYFGTPNTLNESNLGSGSIISSDISDCTVPDLLPEEGEEIIGDIPGGFWTGCAEITEVENTDGSYTVTVDYGNGCEEGDEYFKVFMFGKYTETTRFFDETPELSIGGGILNQGRFEGVTVYENFGSEIDGWRSVMNGESQYSNSFEYFFSESEGAFKIIDKNVYQDALTIETSSEEFTETANVTSDYEEVFEDTEGNEPIIMVNKADYEYVSAESSFSSKVIVPLVLKFECEQQDEESYINVYVSGIEEITYEDETFTIDYGNGECDNLVTITDSEGNTETFDWVTGEVVGE